MRGCCDRWADRWRPVPVFRLCEPCGAEWSRWLDYRVPVPVALITIGSPAVAAREAGALRFRRWRETVRFQQDLTERLCRAGKHAAEH
jgi:hypothetical protein